MKKQIIYICFILFVSICFNVIQIQYSLNKNLKSTILTYEKELNSSEIYLGNVQHNTTLDDVSKINAGISS